MLSTHRVNAACKSGTSPQEKSIFSAMGSDLGAGTVIAGTA